MLNEEQLEELRQFDSPTIVNAIERFNIRPQTEGFMGPEIKSVLSYNKPIIGYVSTAKISAIKPATSEQKDLAMKYYEHVKNSPKPTITVIEDIDPSPVGSFWGEVQTSIHKALGCMGVITSGGVRDLDEVKELGFSYFASTVLVSHAYIHLVDYNCPVEVGGLEIIPGDIVHADKHGVVLIPEEIAPKLADACRKAQEAELPVINGCKNHFEHGDVNLDDLRKWRDEMAEKRKQ